MSDNKSSRYVMDRRETSAVTRARMKDPGYWAGTAAGGLSGGVAGYAAANRRLPKKVRAAMLAGGSAGALVSATAAAASGQRASNKARRKIDYPERDLLGRQKSVSKADAESAYLASRVSKMMPVEVSKGYVDVPRAAGETIFRLSRRSNAIQAMKESSDPKTAAKGRLLQRRMMAGMQRRSAKGWDTRNADEGMRRRPPRQR